MSRHTSYRGSGSLLRIPQACEKNCKEEVAYCRFRDYRARETFVAASTAGIQQFSAYPKLSLTFGQGSPSLLPFPHT